MKDNGIIDNKGYKTMEALCFEAANKTSINTFNAYVHNIDANAIPNDIKVAWDTVSDFVQKMYDSIGGN